MLKIKWEASVQEGEFEVELSDLGTTQSEWNLMSEDEQHELIYDYLNSRPELVTPIIEKIIQD